MSSHTTAPPLQRAGPVSQPRRAAGANSSDVAWRSFYKVGGAAALLAVLVALVDVLTAMLAGSEVAAPGALSATDWFALFHQNWFLGLSNLGLLNVAYNTLMVVVFVALFGALRSSHEPYAALAAAFLFIGAAIYIGNNISLPMLALSGRYAAAATPAEQAALAAAGAAMLAQAEDLTAGAYMGFFFVEVAGLLMALVMLRSGVFGRLTAVLGLVGYALLFVFNVMAAFMPAQFGVTLGLGMAGGPLMMVWFVLVARRLFQLGRSS